MKRFARCMLVICLVCFACSTFSYATEREDYIVGPNDVLEISVWGDEALKRVIVIPPDGKIAFPLIGSLDINGMTIPMIKQAMTQKMNEYVPNAVVTVILQKIQSMTAYVNGKVNKPGQFEINTNTSVMQLLSMAGGFTPFAASSDIIILRNKGGQTIKYQFDYNEVKKGKNLGQNIVIERGDVVVVP